MLNKKKFIPILFFWISFIPITLVSLSRKSLIKDQLENFSANNKNIVLLIFIAINLIYFFFIKYSSKFSFSLKTVYLLVLPILILLYMTPSFLSLDIFGYMIAGKNLAIQNHNPYLLPLNYNPHNYWGNSINIWWLSEPSAYGPLFNILLRLLCSLSSNLLITVYIYKALTLFCYIVILYIFNKLLKLRKASNSLLLLLAFNPALLIHLVLEGHNDVFVILLTLFSIYTLETGKFLQATLSNAIAISVKYVSVILLPIFFIKEGKILIKKAIITGLLSGALLLGFLLYLGKPDLAFIFNNRHFRSDNYCLYVCPPLVRISDYVFGDQSALIRAVLFIVLYIFFIYRFLFKKTDIVSFLFWSFFALIFVYVAWLPPWYLCMLIPLALLLSEKSKLYLPLVFLMTCYSLIIYFGFV